MAKAGPRPSRWPSFEAVPAGTMCHIKRAGSTASSPNVYENAELTFVSGPEGKQSANFFVEGVGVVSDLNEVNYEAWSRHPNTQ